MREYYENLSNGELTFVKSVAEEWYLSGDAVAVYHKGKFIPFRTLVLP